jgi:hypothetical protein
MILLIILVFLVAATSLTIILTIQSETSIRFRCQNYIPVISAQIIENNNELFTQEFNKSQEIILFDSNVSKVTQDDNIFRLYHNNKIREIKTNVFSIYNNSIALKDEKDIIVWSLRDSKPTEHIIANFNGIVNCLCLSGDYVFVGYENIWNRIAVLKRFDYVFSQFLIFHNDSCFQMKCNDKFLIVVSNIVTIFKMTKNEMFIPFQISHFTHNSQIALSDIYHDKISHCIYVKSKNKIHKYSWR